LAAISGDAARAAFDLCSPARPCDNGDQFTLRNSDFFGDIDLDLLFIAGRLKEAKRLEAALDAAGLDYLIETDTYRGGFIFVSERVGAFFYSRPEDTDRARQAMREAGFKPYSTSE